MSDLNPEPVDDPELTPHGIPAGLHPVQPDPWALPSQVASDESPKATSAAAGDALLGLLRAMKKSEECAATAATTTATSTVHDAAHDRQVQARRWEALTAKADAREALQTLCARTGLDYFAAWRTFDAENLAAAQAAAAELREVLDPAPF